ncbi:ATP-grasp domain-containing protein [Halobacillus sp. KGW1]|uniref:ATP-grasp domain-containing protein n=1 Tax=Halobacillus sp. KGW1 TaxID=1793726 RepID=UPI0007810B3C|nr:ATP-grasp domain-containing protein [Halobacillus sp. KGW1]
MSNKRLLILGAGRGQVELIRTAKDKGIETIVGTLPTKYKKGLEIADHICYMDISKPEEVLDKAKELNLDGIATSCLDTGVTSIGKVCDDLGLVGLTEHAAELCQDKFKMKDALMKHDVSTAKFFKVSTDNDVEAALVQLHFPVIIKATDLQGSKGIYIANNKKEAEDGFKKALADTMKEYVIIEEFIEGWEFGAQAFVYNGEVLFVMPHGDDTFMSHTAIPVGHHVPLKCSNNVLHKTEECVKKAIKALDLDNCAVNVDLIVRNDEVYIIELTGRVGANCLPELVSINYGINYYEMIIDLALGNDPRDLWGNKANEKNAGFAEMLFSKEESGVLESISYEGEAQDNLVDLTFFNSVGDAINRFESSGDCIGQVIVKGNDIEECKKTIREIKNNINIKIK